MSKRRQLLKRDRYRWAVWTKWAKIPPDVERIGRVIVPIYVLALRGYPRIRSDSDHTP